MRRLPNKNVWFFFAGVGLATLLFVVLFTPACTPQLEMAGLCYSGTDDPQDGDMPECPYPTSSSSSSPSSSTSSVDSSPTLVHRAPCRCNQTAPMSPDALAMIPIAPSERRRGKVLVVRGSLEPEVSIIMAYNARFRQTFDALKSVVETTPDSIRYELILVDHGSDERMVGPNWLVDRVCGVGLKHLRTTSTNLSFTRAINAAFEHTGCGARFVVLLTNDVIVKEGWLEALRNTFFLHRKAGLVGSKLMTFNAQKKLQEAGGIVWSQASAASYGRGRDPARPEFNYVREVDYCSSAAIMLDMERICRRRRKRASIGDDDDDEVDDDDGIQSLFDGRYAPADYVDADLAMEVRHTLGLSVLYQPAAVVLHNEGSSMVTDIKDWSSLKHHQELNKVKFMDKWRAQLEAHHLSETCPQHLSRDVTAVNRRNLRVLIIEHATPAPDRDSGSLRIATIMDLLMNKKKPSIIITSKDEEADDDDQDEDDDDQEEGGIKCLVTLAVDGFQAKQPYLARLQQTGVEMLHKPYYKSLADVRETHLDFDIIFICRVNVFAAFHDEARRLYPDAKVVYDTADLHFLRLERTAKLEGKQVDPSLQERELSFIRQADYTLVVSSFEYDLLVNKHNISSSKLVRLSNVHEVEPSKPSFANRTGMIFIAHFHHPPNLDGIQWYVKEIHPRVLQQVPDALLNIVGGATELLPAWMANATGVRIVGHVPDTKTIYDQVLMTVAPLRVGAGVKGKVSQSLARGVPVVGTSIAAEGMDLTDGEDVLVADEAQAFADKVVRLWRSEALWAKLRENGWKRVEALFSRRAAQEALKPILESASEAARKGHLPLHLCPLTGDDDKMKECRRIEPDRERNRVMPSPPRETAASP